MEHIVDVLACDIGYFSVKSAYRLRGSIEAFCFPSIATRSTREALRSSAEHFGESTDRIEVHVGGTTYAVNTAQGLLPSSSALRTEVDDFPRSEKYRALVLACLKKIRATKIRYLILGLPVHTLDRHSAYLKSAFADVLRLDARLDCNVERVVVLPQPLGTFAALRDRQLVSANRQVNTAVVDVGWHTSDVVVFHPDGSVDLDRSIGLPGGAARVVREVARLASEKTGTRIDNLDRVDHALLTREPLRHFGEHVDLAPYLGAALMGTREVAEAIVTGLRTTEDLEVFAAGGGARFYLPALSKAMHIDVKLVDRSHLANALGFLAAGEATIRHGAQ